MNFFYESFYGIYLQVFERKINQTNHQENLEINIYLKFDKLHRNWYLICLCLSTKSFDFFTVDPEYPNKNLFGVAWPKESNYGGLFFIPVRLIWTDPSIYLTLLDILRNSAFFEINYRFSVYTYTGRQWQGIMKRSAINYSPYKGVSEIFSSLVCGIIL